MVVINVPSNHEIIYYIFMVTCLILRFHFLNFLSIQFFFYCFDNLYGGLYFSNIKHVI